MAGPQQRPRSVKGAEVQWNGYAKLQSKNALRVGPRADFAFHNIPLAPPPAALSVTTLE
jgi:hypothetical protein